MIIGGIQKLTLVDFPGRVATIVFTKGCVFRCPYCHNPDLVVPKDYSGIPEEEWWEHLRRRQEFIDGVVVSGGEPTLHEDLPEFIAKIKDMGFAVKLDTNGITPRMLARMFDNHLIDYVAMDIKHQWRNYQTIANIKEEKQSMLSRCKEAFDMIRASGVPYEWRTTLLPGVHTEEDVVAIAEGFLPGEQYYLQTMNYRVTLKKDLDQTKALDVVGIAKRLKMRFPQLLIDCR